MKINNIIVIILIIAVFSLSLCEVSGGGVSVINTEPKFADVSLRHKSMGVYELSVVTSDYNGWWDLSTITVSVIENGKLISRFGYRQVEKEFFIYYGDNLMKSSVFFSYANDTVQNITEMKTVYEFKGRYDFVKVVVEDLHGGSASISVDFPSSKLGYKVFPMSLIVAGLITTGVTYKKYKKSGLVVYEC